MEVHESVYQELKKSGCQGWGGSSYDNRMNGWNEQLEKLFGLIRLKGSRVLELGSGAGDVSLRVAQRGYEVTGVEISPTATEWAKQKANDMNINARFICKSVVSRAILENEKFDLIIDGNCLHCLFDEDRASFYNNMKRLIEHGGYAFISSAVINHIDDKTPKISSIDRCFVTRQSIIEEVERRGFKLVEDWSSKGSHEHYYGLFQYVNG